MPVLMAPTGKRRVRFFLSYAHDDRALVGSFRHELEKQYSGAARYEYRVWSDGQIPLGTRWREEIDRAVGEFAHELFTRVQERLDAFFKAPGAP